MTKKQSNAARARYPLEFKLEAVRMVDNGESIAATARSVGVVDQTLFNGVKLHKSGQLKGADSKPLSAEQMEISRLRAEPARVKMERDILLPGSACDLGADDQLLVEQRCAACGVELKACVVER